MCLEIRKLSIDDGHDIYEMLQELPADENGFINPVLLTIRNHNAPSIHVALANGGKIEKITADKHYIWIEP